MSESDLNDAMKQMDVSRNAPEITAKTTLKPSRCVQEDGSGEVDLEEFSGWYKSLTASSGGGAPNKLVPIPGAGHVPFGAIPPCDPAGKGHSSGCFNTSFFGFLLGALELDGVACPAKPRAAGLKNIIGS